MKILVILLFATLFTATNIFAQSSTKDWTISTYPGMTGEIKVISTDIKISKGSYNRVEIRFETNIPERIPEYEVLETSNGFSIKQKENVLTSQTRNILEKFFITVPDYYNLNITSVSGDLQITDIEGMKKITTASADVEIINSNGSTKVSTASGDVDIENSNGGKEINTASGDIFVRSSSGDLKINSASGDISLGNAEGKVKANTASGDILIITSSAIKEINANSYSGSISVSLSNVQGISLKATTVSGELSLDESFNIRTNNQRISKTVSGIAGNGEVTVVCSNVSGDITITR